MTSPTGSARVPHRARHEPGVPGPGRRRAPRRRRLVLGGLGVLLLIGGTWLVVAGLQVHSSLTAVRAHLERAGSAGLSGDPSAAGREVSLAAIAAGEARAASSSPPWVVAASVPVVGGPFRSARDLAAVVDELVVEVLRPVLSEASTLFPDRLRPAGGQIDLAAIAGSRPVLTRAAEAARAVDRRAGAITPSGYVAQLDDASHALQARIRQLADGLEAGRTAAELLPAMLGAEAPRRYLLAFQTTAEARGTGGLIGGFGILTADRGTLDLDTLASNRELESGAPPGLDLGPEYAEQYAGYSSTTLWSNANSSPHFPYAARIWSSLWEQQGGGRIDGVVAMDPFVLAHVLGAVGAVTLPGGEVVGAADVVRITGSEAYLRFGADTAGRKDYLQSIVRAVAEEVFAGSGSTTAMLGALTAAAGQSRLAVWSAVPEEQAVLAGTALGREVARTTAPHAAVVVNNGSGDKLDHYLSGSLGYSAGPCSGPDRWSLVSVDLRNGAPAGPLPESVTGPRARKPPGAANTNRLVVSLYATEGAALRGVSVDGVPATARIGRERGHPVFTLGVEIEAQATRNVVFDLVEPTAAGAPVVPVQPLARPLDVTVAVPDCGAP